MKKTIAFFLVLFPLAASAATSTVDKLYNAAPGPNELWCATAVCDLEDMFKYIIYDILKLVPVLAVLFIIVGGFKMIMANGNEERYTEARKTVVWAIFGLVISILSFSIVAIVQNFFSK